MTFFSEGKKIKTIFSFTEKNIFVHRKKMFLFTEKIAGNEIDLNICKDRNLPRRVGPSLEHNIEYFQSELNEQDH